jgi:hypothetical protein
MFDFHNGWVVGGWIGGVVLLLGIGPLLFQAGCALADVNGPNFLRSLGLFVVTLVVCVPIIAGLWWLAGASPNDSATWWGPMCLAALVGGGILAWIVSGLIYMLTLAAPYRKGLVIAGTELILGVLLTALISAVVLVVLAGVQISKQAPGRATGDAPTLQHWQAGV